MGKIIIIIQIRFKFIIVYSGDNVGDTSYTKLDYQ